MEPTEARRADLATCAGGFFSFSDVPDLRTPSLLRTRPCEVASVLMVDGVFMVDGTFFAEVPEFPADFCAFVPPLVFGVDALTAAEGPLAEGPLATAFLDFGFD